MWMNLWVSAQTDLAKKREYSKRMLRANQVYKAEMRGNQDFLPLSLANKRSYLQRNFFNPLDRLSKLFSEKERRETLKKIYLSIDIPSLPQRTILYLKPVKNFLSICLIRMNFVLQLSSCQFNSRMMQPLILLRIFWMNLHSIFTFSTYILHSDG